MIQVDINEAAMARVGGAQFSEEDLLPGIQVRAGEVHTVLHPTHQNQRIKAVGVLKGRQAMPYELAELSFDAGWSAFERLVEAVSVWLAESQGYTEAENRNYDDGGKLLSIDVGVCQINIPAEKDGSNEHEMLFDPAYNLKRARQLYDTRGFQPWVAHTTGIAHDVNWWKWSDMRHEWRPTGRYPHRALRGAANFYARNIKIPAIPTKAGGQTPFLDYHSIPPKPTGDPGP